MIGKGFEMDTVEHELLELAESEGLTLPYSVGFIRCVEALGYVVDLETGALEIEVGGVQWRFQPPALGGAAAGAAMGGG